MVATAMPPAIASTTTVPADSAAIQAAGLRQVGAREGVAEEGVMAGREQEQAPMVPHGRDVRVKCRRAGLHTDFTQACLGRADFKKPSNSLLARSRQWAPCKFAQEEGERTTPWTPLPPPSAPAAGSGSSP